MSTPPDKGSWGKRWAIVGALVTALGSLFKVVDLIPKLLSTDEKSWTLYFIPDLVVAAGIVFLIVSIAMRWGRKAALSYWHWMRHARMWQAAAVALPVAGALVISGLGYRDLRNYYRLRVFDAKFDWEYWAAKKSLQRGDYEGAVDHFRRTRKVFLYLPPWVHTRSNSEATDTIKRLEDVKQYIARYKAVSAGRTPSLTDVLLIQRASRLCPDCADVQTEARDAAAKLPVALGLYIEGVVATQKGGFGGAHEKFLQEPMRLFHEDLLLRYCSRPDRNVYESDERDLLDAYLNTPPNQIRPWLEEHPYVVAVREMPVNEAPRYGPTYRELEQQRKDRPH